MTMSPTGPTPTRSAATARSSRSGSGSCPIRSGLSALAAARHAGLADPLPLRYVARRAARAEDPVQRLFVPDYQGTAIWSSLGAIYLQLLDRVDPAAAEAPLRGWTEHVERAGTVWEVIRDDGRPYIGRLGIFRADEAMLWSAILADLLERRAARPVTARPGASD